MSNSSAMCRMPRRRHLCVLLLQVTGIAHLLQVSHFIYNWRFSGITHRIYSYSRLAVCRPCCPQWPRASVAPPSLIKNKR